MCDIFKDNFEEKYPQVESAIRKADFIAIDTEFTGLQYHSDGKPSLFDDGAKRYSKLRQSVQRFTVVQLGLSAFKKVDVCSSEYIAHTYNFYLYPVAFGPVDNHFTCQVSSLDFLCQHKFDFNKLVYNGVPYLRPDQAEAIEKFVSAPAGRKGTARDWDERSVQQHSSQVAAWLATAPDGDCMTIDCQDAEADMLPQHLAHEMRKRFDNIWAEEKDTSVVIYKIPAEKRQEYKNKAKLEEERLIRELIGFGRVFSCLVESKKPIVGHNCFSDLLFLMDKFHSPLPEKFSHFLGVLHEAFPKLYDTKHISLKMKRDMEDSPLFENTALGDLYKNLNGDKANAYKPYSPQINHAEGCGKYKSVHVPHEAGYDAYMCGNVFIRLAHIAMSQNLTASQMKTFTFGEYLTKFEQYCNQLNLIRAGISHVNVEDGSSLGSSRPNWLYVKGRFGRSLEAATLAQQFLPYGSSDVQLLSSNQALVAVAAHRTAREILKNFKSSPDFRVTEYNRWRHSPIIRKFMWCVFFKVL